MAKIGEYGDNFEKLAALRGRIGEKAKLGIKDPSRMLNELAKSYRPAEAFKEYPSNSIDEKLEEHIQGTLEARILVSRNYGALFVEDNGSGMTKEKIRIKLEQIGDSEKNPYDNTIGNRGLGLQAFRRFAGHLYLISKKANASLYTLAEVSKKEAYANIRELSEKEFANLNNIIPGAGFPLMERHGTRAVLSGISKEDITNHFTREKLKIFLGEMYAPLLMSEDVKIKIGYASRVAQFVEVSSPFSPGNFTGEKLLEDKRNMGKNFIEALLIYDPRGTTRKASLYCKGARIIPVSDLEGFDIDPWNSGKIFGMVNTNMIDRQLSGTRNMVAPDWNDPVFKMFYSTMQEYTKLLSEKKASTSIYYKENKLHGTIEEILDALGPIAKRVLSRQTFVKSKGNGQKIPATPTGEEARKLPDGERKKTYEGDEKKERKNDSPEVKPGEGPMTPVKTGWQGYAKPGYETLEFDIVDREKRSCHNAARKILMNELHADFKKEVGEDYESPRAKDYMLFLICKELTSMEFERWLQDEKDPAAIKEFVHESSEMMSELYLDGRRALGLEKLVKKNHH